MLDCLDLGEYIQVKQKSSAKSLIITFWISEATMVGFRLTCAESDDATTGHKAITYKNWSPNAV
jgi:hypothetical protein